MGRSDGDHRGRGPVVSATLDTLLGADAPLGRQLLIAIIGGHRNLGEALVVAIREVHGQVSMRPESDGYDTRLREGVRVLKTLEAHGLVDCKGLLR